MRDRERDRGRERERHGVRGRTDSVDGVAWWPSATPGSSDDVAPAPAPSVISDALSPAAAAAAAAGAAAAAASAAEAGCLYCTLTVTRTGLRRPALASCSTSSVSVAENRPVRRCLGSRARMALRLTWKPSASRRSASSSTSTSSGLTERNVTDSSTWTSRPGVPTMMFAPTSRSCSASRSVSWPPMHCATRSGAAAGRCGVK